MMDERDNSILDSGNFGEFVELTPEAASSEEFIYMHYEIHNWDSHH
jgi:hypothetical protein